MSTVKTNQGLEICVLGSFSVSVNGQPVKQSAWQRRHARQLIKLLAIAPRHRLHRDVLMHQFWPNTTQEKASNNLNKVLYMARRALEPSLAAGIESSFIRRSGEVVELISHKLLVDAVQFEAETKTVLERGDYAQLVSCTELYTGDLLADELFEDQFVPRREALARLYHQVLLKLSEQAIAVHKIDAAVDALNDLLRIDPLNENYHRRLINLYHDNNLRSKALIQFEKCQSLLNKELGQPPDAETMSLHSMLASRYQSPPDETATHAVTQTPAPTNPADKPHALAVLPLENTSGNDEFDYLCEGITENLIFSLSRLPGQRVMALSTVFRFKGQPFDPTRLRDELSVNRVVLGRVSHYQGRVRIWIELVSTDDGVLLWAQHYDRDLLDIQQLQKNVANDLIAYFRSALGVPAPTATHELPTVDPEAYHLYLKGRYHWNKRNGAAMHTAQGYFHSALDHDPVYALAWSGLADTWNVMSLITSAAPHDTMPKARAAAARALEIDPQCCEAHTSLAYCQVSYDWHWRDAEASFTRALQLNPGYATAHQWYHKMLVARGRFDEASKQISEAKQLDPLSLMIRTEESWGLYHSRRYDDAIRHLENVLADDPQFAMAHYILGLAHTQTSRLDQAIENFEAASANQQSSSPFVLQLGALGHVLAKAGQTSESQNCLAKLRKMDPAAGSVAYASAMIHVGSNNSDAALASLEKAFEARLDRLIFLQVEPLFDSLHEHSRFIKMCQQLGDLAT